MKSANCFRRLPGATDGWNDYALNKTSCISLQGDVLKLKAKVADLEAKLPSEPNIILTR